ncbi:hypothetical protein [Aquimarina sediminis]|uniref:hypothetical protein n=1 Tax=Aquimarina sediminis TaxID=2070536 RepID=UPI000CA06AD9|nr:hypothetical protein [Aquimarina sediminis]
MQNNQYILFIIVLLVFSCRNHEIPKAKIGYESFFKNKSNGNYYLKINSDLKIDNLLGEEGASFRIICPLKLSSDFTTKDIEKIDKFIIGTKFEHQDFNDQQKYIIEMNFIDDSKERLSETFLNKNQIRSLIETLECISCKIQYRFFMDTQKPYLSNPMCIPVKDILEVLEE